MVIAAARRTHANVFVRVFRRGSNAAHHALRHFLETRFVSRARSSLQTHELDPNPVGVRAVDEVRRRTRCAESGPRVIVDLAAKPPNSLSNFVDVANAKTQMGEPQAIERSPTALALDRRCSKSEQLESLPARTANELRA